ncbi:hypothetical protein Tco_0736152 [Tanacetum coccineum]
MGRDTIQLENAVSTISQEYPLEFTSEYSIPEGLYPELPGPEDMIVDFSKGKFEMDLFNLISAPNPTKVKTGTRPRAAHEVPLLTVTASRVIDMEDPAAATESSGTPSTIEKSPLDFANENPSQQITEGDGTGDQVRDEVSREIPSEENPTTTGVVPELEKEVAVIGPRVNKRRRKRASDEADANAPPKVLRKDHAAARPEQSTHGGKSLASIGLEAGTTCVTPATQEALLGAKSVSDPDPLSYARPQPHPERDMAQEYRKPKRVKDYAYHKEKMMMCKQAESGVPLQAEQADWLEDTDEEIDEQELEAHYSYMAKIQEVSHAESSSTDTPLEQVQNYDENDMFANVRRHSEQPESINDTYVLEKDDSNVIPDSSNICTNDNQVDQNAAKSVDERAALANLIANLTLDTEENKMVLKQLKKANASLTQELKECKTNLDESSTRPLMT